MHVAEVHCGHCYFFLVFPHLEASSPEEGVPERPVHFRRLALEETGNLDCTSSCLGVLTLGFQHIGMEPRTIPTLTQGDRLSVFSPSFDSSLLASGRSKQLSKESKPSTTGAREATMIGSNSRSFPSLARWAESYEAKCERRQEARESLHRRRNETTCRQPGKVLRTQHKEHLQRARQLQFLRRRNLEEEKKGQSREQRPSSKTDGGTGQVSILKKSEPGANRTSFPGQQVRYDESLLQAQG